jgi:predicted MFS family arabinose efflux permease
MRLKVGQRKKCGPSLRHTSGECDAMTGSSPQGEQATPHVPPFSPAYVRYALWLLLIIYTFNFVDRQIVAILATQIKTELGLSDTQIGLLSGIAFAFFYTLMGIPIARYAERANRATIIGTAVIVWSGFTALSGLAQNFTQLLLARIGVGVGEAGCTPPAHALISDYVSPEKRASAIAFYSLGVPIGTAFGYLFGAQLGAAFGWRVAFLVVGLPGLILGALAIATLKEPRKLGLVAAKSHGAAPGFGEALAVLSKKKSYMYAVLAVTMISFLGYGHAVFTPQFFARSHGLALKDIGTVTALMALVAGGLGTFVGGFLADKTAKADVRAYVSTPAIAFILGIPFFLMAMNTDNLALTIALLSVPTFTNAMWYGPVYAAVQGLAPVRIRATAVAIMLFVINMIGLGLGPLVIGMASDYFAGQAFVSPVADGSFASFCAKGAATARDGACLAASAEGLRQSLMWSMGVAVIALWAFFMAHKTIAQDLAETAAAAKAA